MTPSKKELFDAIKSRGQVDIDWLVDRFPDYGRQKMLDRMRGFNRHGYVKVVGKGVWEAVQGKSATYSKSNPYGSITQPMILTAAAMLREFRLCEIVDHLDAHHAKGYVVNALARLASAGLVDRVGRGEYRATESAYESIPKSDIETPVIKVNRDNVQAMASDFYATLENTRKLVWLSDGQLHYRRKCAEAEMVGAFSKESKVSDFVTACRAAFLRMTKGSGKPRVIGSDLKGVSV